MANRSAGRRLAQATWWAEIALSEQIADVSNFSKKQVNLCWFLLKNSQLYWYDRSDDRPRQSGLSQLCLTPTPDLWHRRDTMAFDVVVEPQKKRPGRRKALVRLQICSFLFEDRLFQKLNQAANLARRTNPEQTFSHVLRAVLDDALRTRKIGVRPLPKASPHRRVCVNFDPVLLARLHEVREQERATLSDVVRFMLEAGLASNFPAISMEPSTIDS